MTTDVEWLRDLVRDIPDHPQPGVVFKDITPLLADPKGLAASVDAIVERFADARVDRVVGIEARGFIFGAPVAHAMGAGFVPVRKPGKLPWQTRGEEYALEYGTDRLEMHLDALGADHRVLIVDDVLATGGTAAATARLVEHAGATVVGLAFLMELEFLAGRSKLGMHDVQSLLRYS
jgi:adenine phosphoribosyltransferase